MKRGGLFNRHKFIDDYVVREELDGSGRTVQRVYYSAEYYETDWSDGEARSFKRLTVLFSVLSLAASVYAISVYHDSMAVIYVIMAYVFSMITSLLMLASAFQLPKDAEPMEKTQKYHGFERLKERALLTLIAGAYGTVSNIVFCLIIYPKQTGAALKYPVTDAIVTLCGLIIAGTSYYCLKRLRSANIHLSDKENEWDRLSRQLAEQETEQGAEEQ